ncbi:DNA repair ATPase [Salininema proteolyticum]|uniref:DNA repair ATPase n=1 Tax=Salininema proteolyticum TaxID=1607685 RepID=A0ABV8TU87_9ACTN
MAEAASEPTTTEETDEAPNEGALDQGTYEVLTRRLAARADELSRRAEALNGDRVEAFGSTELTLLGTARVRTANNCVPRDMVQVGGKLLFGYNVHIGLRSTTGVSDVFTVYDFAGEGGKFALTEAEETHHVLGQEQFTKDFTEMYRYYRGTELYRIRETDSRILAVFTIGDNANDRRVLRWRNDGSLDYIDNKGEADDVQPADHDFEWTVTTRDMHVNGRHPHVSIEDELFVECVGGSLTVKVEDNTATGEGIYSEPVDERLQSLADADISYARVGPLLLLKILPYKEQRTRYLLYNTRTGDIRRVDEIGLSCRALPEDHGIIFPGGYYLNEGVLKTFQTDDVEGLTFQRALRSPNGEDVLYVFYDHSEGRSLLLPYNLIRKEVAAPMSVHGYTIFDDGTLLAFRAQDEPTRVHTLQIWESPFISDARAAALEAEADHDANPIARVGNAEAVRAVSDSLSVVRAVREAEPTQAVYEALIALATRCVDDYPWLADEGLHGLNETLGEIRETAESVLDEYATVTELTDLARKNLAEAKDKSLKLIRRARGEAPKSAGQWVDLLTELRGQIGHAITLRDTKYIDREGLDAVQADLEECLDSTARRAVSFLERDDAFDSYHKDIDGLSAKAESLETVAEAAPVLESLAAHQEGLDGLTQVVANLDIADATVRTAILGRVSEVLAAVNRTRASLEARKRSLAEGEGRAEFAAEYALLNQAVTAALSNADNPSACDEQLARLLVTIENLETRFADFDEFATQLEDKRNDVYEAFTSRKQSLLDEAARRAGQLADSADRILEAVKRRAAGLDTLDEINTYFASDPMIERLRKVVGELRGLDETVRAEEIEGRIQTARQEAGRALLDNQDLYDGDAIKFGRHRLPVNSQPLDLTLVAEGDSMAFSLAGTDYRSRVEDPEFLSTREYWDQHLPSENAFLYRAAFLATSLLEEHGPARLGSQDLAALCTSAASERYDEGYERGVHDSDAAAILAELLRLRTAAGTLRYPAASRALARLWWTHGAGSDQRERFRVEAVSRHKLQELFGGDALKDLRAEVAEAVADWDPIHAGSPASAAEYLIEELAEASRGFALSGRAKTLLDGFDRHLSPAVRDGLDKDLAALEDSLASQWHLAYSWLEAYASQSDDERFDAGDLPEAAAHLVAPTDTYDLSADLYGTVENLLGTHPTVKDRTLSFRLDDLLDLSRHFRSEVLPGYRAYQEKRSDLVARHKESLRLEEYKPRVMSSFVRNQLIDEVYLELIGANLTKQIGAGSEGNRRTDQSGLLMLISPPGYGKTTLMEYVADRLGMMLVKVNGPSLGHGTVSVDPDEAPNATARQEVEKINFALECGNNVLLYLDDIQHTNPELLQKFISLCDGTRRMEGVWNGRTRTYDMRGKRFAVCMAGNPYTEAGQKFRIPDMLANRADVWNLGDILGGREDLFAQSYIENALTSNPVTTPLSGRSRSDVRLIIRLAADDPTATQDDLEHPYSAGELDQILSVMRKLLHIQKTVLRNNMAYIESAATDDASRTEPAFFLQGSYRNMARLAERVVPVMNEEELEAVIDDHYRGEAQTLAAGAEANLLKLKELRGRLSDEEKARWAEVKESFLKQKALGGGSEEDPVNRAIGAIGLLSDQVSAIGSVMRDYAAQDPKPVVVQGSAGSPASGPAPAASSVEARPRSEQGGAARADQPAARPSTPAQASAEAARNSGNDGEPHEAGIRKRSGGGEKTVQLRPPAETAAGEPDTHKSQKLWGPSYDDRDAD